MSTALPTHALLGDLNTSEKATMVVIRPMKRTTSSKSGSEASEAFTTISLAPTTTQTSQSRDLEVPKKTKNIVTIISRDLNIVDEMSLQAPQMDSTKKKSAMGVETSSGLVSPTMKHIKSLRQFTQKDSTVNVERRKYSVWDIMGHLFSRLFIIFIVGAGLGVTTVWSYRGSPPPSIQKQVDLENLEDFVMKTTKWMQVQLEVIDTKIGKEVGDLRQEVRQKIDSQVIYLGSEVRSMKAQVDKLYKSTGGPLTKNEVMDLMKSLIDKRIATGGGKHITLGDIQSAARQIVLSELEKHSADGIGRVDYALASGGGRVVEHSEGYSLGRGGDWSTLMLNLLRGASRKHHMANKVLEPSFGEPGQCLPLKGTNVFVEISLRTAILPNAITLEHVSKNAGYDVKSAPKDFRVFGWHELRQHVDGTVVRRLLGQFTYDVEGPSIQTFQLSDEDVGGVLINMLRTHVLSNHAADRCSQNRRLQLFADFDNSWGKGGMLCTRTSDSTVVWNNQFS